jgi:hypothetical protein
LSDLREKRGERVDVIQPFRNAGCGVHDDRPAVRPPDPGSDALPALTRRVRWRHNLVNLAGEQLLSETSAATGRTTPRAAVRPIVQISACPSWKSLTGGKLGHSARSKHDDPHIGVTSDDVIQGGGSQPGGAIEFAQQTSRLEEPFGQGVLCMIGGRVLRAGSGSHRGVKGNRLCAHDHVQFTSDRTVVEPPERQQRAAEKRSGEDDGPKVHALVPAHL